MSSLTQKNKIIRRLEPSYISNSFVYNSLLKETTETSIFDYQDRVDEKYSHLEKQDSTDFKLKFFPISVFFSDTRSLKTICDKYKFDIFI